MRLGRSVWIGAGLLVTSVWISCGQVGETVTHRPSIAVQAEAEETGRGDEGLEDSEEALWRRLATQLNESGIAIGSTGEFEIRQLIANGLTELQGEDGISEAELRHAEDSLGKFGQQLITQAEHLRGDDERVVEGSVVRAVELDVCPLYPFC